MCVCFNVFGYTESSLLFSFPSGCSQQGLLLVAVHGLLTVLASLVAGHRL